MPDANDTFRAELDRRQALPADNPEYIGPTTAYAPPPVVPVVPRSATRLGLKRAFDEQGKWPAIKAAIAADPDRQEEWDLATEIMRSDPLAQAMIGFLQLTDAEVDALLIRAAELVAPTTA